MFTFALGFRYLHHYSPNFGVGFIKFNHVICSPSSGNNIYSPQLMTGVRGYIPFSTKCMSLYGAFRLGFGLSWDDKEMVSGVSYGSCYEMEIGLNFSRYFFIAYSYNNQNVKVKWFWGTDTVIKASLHALRIGFNIGK